MATNTTFLLLSILLLAAGLGVIIGAALMRLRDVHSLGKASRESQIALTELRSKHTDLESRYAAVKRAVVKENQLLAESKNKQEQAAAQQDALQVHARLQAQRIASLEASLSAAEERGLRQQRDFESYKSHKQRELELSRASASMDRSQSLPDSDLPVLKKRVTQTDLPLASTAAASVEAIQAMLQQAEEIPALAESELAGSVNDIDFEKMLEDEISPIG